MKLNQSNLNASFADVPHGFEMAMRRAFSQIHQQETASQPPRRYARRLSFGTVALIVLLIAAIAIAATQWHIFDSLSFLTGASPTNADKIMQSDLYQTTINNVEITVKEAGYDGKTLFIQYSYRMLDVDEKLGMFADKYKDSANYGTGGISEEEMQLLVDHHVGWWIDQLWINGKCVDMQHGSGGSTSGSAIPGEIVQTEYWRLDNENAQLTDKLDISLPIGEKQSVRDYNIREHPERYDADGNMLLPDKGIVTFTLNTADILSQVRVEHPNLPVKGENVTAQVSEVYYSPLTTYITLKLEGDADAIADYKAENGEGYMSEDGKTLLYEYGGMEVFGDWISSLTLVDGDGKEVFPGTCGDNGCSNDWAEFVYPYIDNMPNALYLAPMDGEAANMEQAIKVK